MPHGSGRWWCSIRPVATTGNSPTAPNATGRGGLIVSQTISARFVLRSSTGQTRSGQSFGAGAVNGRTSRARLTTRCRFYRGCCRTRSTRWAVSLATHARASSSFTAPTGRRSSGSRPTSRTSRRRALPTSGSQSRALRKGGQAGDSPKDHRADLTIQSVPNHGNASPAEFLQKRRPPPGIQYKGVTPRFFAVSSIRNGRTWYNRCNRADGYMHCVLINYPAAEDRQSDAIVTRISLSLAE